jgi:acyl-CoA synthetase (AMP-forming)/AMP-acid ligase II
MADLVLIMIPDSWDFAPVFAGVIQHGAVPLPINPLLPGTTSWQPVPPQEPA